MAKCHFSKPWPLARAALLEMGGKGAATGYSVKAYKSRNKVVIVVVLLVVVRFVKVLIV